MDKDKKATDEQIAQFRSRAHAKDAGLSVDTTSENKSENSSLFNLVVSFIRTLRGESGTSNRPVTHEVAEAARQRMRSHGSH